MNDNDIAAGVDSYLANERETTAATIRNNFMSTAGTTPDEFAKAIAVSKATGIPVQSLFADPEVAKQHRALQGTDFSGLVVDRPKTASFLANPSNAGIARDDVDNLGEMEKIIHRANYFGGSMVAGVHNMLSAGARMLDAVNPFTAGAKELAYLEKFDPEGYRAAKVEEANSFLNQYALRQDAAAKRVMEQEITPEARAMFYGRKYLSLGEDSAWRAPWAIVGDAVRSLPTTLSLLATAVFAKGAGAAATYRALSAGIPRAEAQLLGVKAAQQAATAMAPAEGAIAYGQQAVSTEAEGREMKLAVLEKSPEYQALIASGFSPENARAVLARKTGELAGRIAGVWDTAVNVVGGKYLGKIIGEGAGVLSRFGKGAANEAITETLQSGGEQAATNFAVKMNLDPTRDLMLDVAESMAQGFAVGGLTGGGFAAALGQSADDQRAVDGAEAMASLFSAAARSLTTQRSPETLNAFLQHTAPDATVLIDADKLQDVLAQTGVSLDALPSAAAQLTEEGATFSGPGVEIPVGELVAGLSGTEAEKAILQHLRMGADLPTLAEAQAHDASAAAFFQKEAERVGEEMANNQDFIASAQEVKSDIYDQLVAVGRQSNTVNRGYAELAGAFYSVLAHDLGITPTQLRDGWTDANGVARRGYRLSIGDGGDTTSAFDQNGKPTPIFYSNLSKQVEAAPPKVFTTARQIKNWLNSNAGKLGIKKDEIKYTGIEEYLDALGDEKVSKQTLLDFMATGGVQLEETVKGDAQDSGTQYHAYQLPGGSDYKELLIRLPSRADPQLDALAQERHGVSFGALGNRERTDILRELEAADDNFKSGHWDEENILAHVRFSTRTDAEGNKVLFIEEVQSDWGQVGKRKGFRDPVVEERIKALRAELAAMAKDRDPKTNQMREEKRWFEGMKELGRLDGEKGTIPDAPFVKDTKAWVALALKRMMRYAADNGMQKIAFINGQQSAERYQLSQAVKYMGWAKEGDGGRFISLALHQNPVQMHVDAKGIVTKTRFGLDEAVGKSLDEVIGKDVAKRVMSEEEGDIEGEELNIGGEGMKAFYDEIVPQVANDLLKKMGGGKVGMVSLGSPEKKYEVHKRTDGLYGLRSETDMWYGAPLESKEAAEKVAARLNGDMQQRGFTVPASAALPQPMFQKSRQTETPEFKQWFGDWQDPRAFSSKYPADKVPVSQAVSDDGAPLVLYHATNNDFSVFETRRDSVTSTTFGPVETKRHAIFATPTVGFAESYLKNAPGQNVMPVYMDIKAPMDLRNNKAWDYADELHAAGFPSTRWPNLPDTQMWEMFDDETGEAFVAAAKKAGYDGAIMFELDDTDHMVEVYVAFAPEQIKSAIGNRGTFSANDANILRQSSRGALRDQYQWQVMGEDENGPIFAAPNFVLAPVRALPVGGGDFEQGGTAAAGLMGHAAHVTPGSTTYLFAIMQGDAKVGELAADVLHGDIVAIHDIAAYTEKQGLGFDVVAHIAANNYDTTRAVDILDQSRGFWEKAGVNETDQYGNGTFDWQSVERYLVGRSASDPGRSHGVSPHGEGQVAPGAMEVEELDEAAIRALEDQGFTFKQATRSAPRAQRSTFTRAGIANLLREEQWAVFTAENPNAKALSDEENAERNAALEAELRDAGYDLVPVVGKYGPTEHPFAVLGISPEEASRLGTKYEQESVLTRYGLVYQDGTITPATGLTIHDTPPEDFYTTLPDGTTFTVDLDFDAERVPSLRDAKARDTLKQGNKQAAAVAGPVIGVHMSRVARSQLSSSAFGTGHPGAERERLANSNDPRIKQRIAFYVSNGSGIHPEEGVGTQAHIATLTNLYDADADALKLFRNNRDPNAAESAILDAGFDGFLSRNSFTNEGTVVMLGARTIPAQHVGTVDDANPLAAVPPAADIPAMKMLAIQLVNDRTLPGGAMTPAEWQAELTKRYPEMAAQMDFSALRPNERYYKDELARLLWGRDAEGNALGAFNPATFELSLLAKANYSTFVHELGHVFLTVYADLAAQPGAPQKVVDGVAAMLKHAGIEGGLSAWNAMSLEQQRAAHEKIAESFEQYVFTGKAPTVELQSLFRAMMAWMKRVYQSIKNFVATHEGATLNPELATVFDRMLATDADIAAAVEIRNYTALFANAADAGMSDADFAAYMQLGEAQRADAADLLRARSLRDTRWLQARRNEYIAKAQQEAKEKRQAMRREVAKEVADEPIRQAERYLRRGVVLNADGMDVAPLGANKLQISEVEKLFPADSLVAQPDWRRLGYGKYGMLAETGLAPEEVAERFGLPSGETLVRELLGLSKINDEIEARTDQRMLEAYGDLSSPEAIAQAADEALHNAARTRMVATELSALAREVGPMQVLLKAAKAYADALIGNKTYNSLKPWAFAAAETRAGKEAMRALRTGDRQKAATEKRTELVNQVTAKRAYETQREVDKLVARLKKLGAYNDESSAVKSRDFATVQAVRSLLAEHGLAPERKGEKADAYLETVRKNDPATADRIQELISVTGETPKPWADITIDNLREFAQAIDDIWFLASRARQFEVQGKLVAEKEVIDELYKTLEETGKLEARAPGEGYAVTESEARGITLDGWSSVLKRMDAVAYALDGQRTMGPWQRNIVGVIQDAASAMTADKADKLGQYYALIKALEPTLGRQTIDAPEIGYVFGKGPGGSGRAELLHALLHTGNESNLRKLLIGRGWAAEQPDGTPNTAKWDAFLARMRKEGKLTKADYDFAQGVWDLLDSMKPAAQKAHRIVFGKYFAEVTANSFTNEFGTYRGGYVPAQTDPVQVHKANERRLAEQENDSMKLAFPAPAKGFTASRVDSYAKPLLLDLSSLGGHINKVLLFSHMAAPVNDVRRVLSNAKVSDAVHRVSPGLIPHTLIPWLNRAAKHTTSLTSAEFGSLGRFLRAARSNAGTNTMMGNLSNAVQQLTGIIPASVDIKGKYLREALVNGLVRSEDTREYVKSLSPYMAGRIDNEAASMMHQIEEVLVNPTVFQSAQRWTRDHAYLLQSAVDAATTPPLWLAAYNQARDAHPELSQADCVHIADALIRQTQGSSGPLDISTFEAGHPFFQLFTQFYGYFNSMAQFLHGRMVKTLASEMPLPAKYARAFYIVAIGFYAQAVAAELVALLFRGGPADDDHDGELYDEWLAQLFLYAPAKFALTTIPFLGQTIQGVFNSFNDKPYDDRLSLSPVVSVIEAGMGATRDTYRAIFEDGRPSKPIKGWAAVIGLFTGLPTSALARPIGYGADVLAERTQPTSAADAVRGTITGVSSPDSKQ